MTKRSPVGSFRVGAIRSLALVVAMSVSSVACGGDDPPASDSDDGPSEVDPTGTWSHPEEGTIVLTDDGTGAITQSGDPVAFTWTLDGDDLSIDVDGDAEPDAVASVADDEMTFRVGDFSGDEAVTFTRD